MRALILLLLFIPGFFHLSCAQQVPNPANQITSAVMAAPEDQRAKAEVFGYDADGNYVQLREGSNMLICVADDPGREGFQVVCYHRTLEPFMARGRELRAEGLSSGDIFDQREKEAKAGTLQMPEQPATLHLLEGADGRYDPGSGEVENARYRYVVYIPWATAASTGLPTSPIVPGAPWIMDPGTHRAHIMVTPPAPDK